MTNATNSTQTPALVASKATQSRALPKSGLSLLGLFGAEGNMQAMVRLPSGRVKTVKPGSRVAQGKVLGIDANGLVLESAGRTQRITMPGS
ncbi:hypothetical protein [Pseudophaeobacter sp.]|uniref:hypothetical protein n=1 Tax=Pseudophaeobacter sp. TaxID=1971739 RepID=UPI0032976505